MGDQPRVVLRVALVIAKIRQNIRTFEHSLPTLNCLALALLRFGRRVECSDVWMFGRFL
jgi:hypothetical protein